MSEIGNFYENIGGEAGRKLDETMLKWRQKGINGTPEEREEFLKQCFYGARFNMRMVLLASNVMFPGKSRREILEGSVPKIMESIADQARESGFSDEQTKEYVDTHQKAYDSLKEEFGGE